MLKKWQLVLLCALLAAGAVTEAQVLAGRIVTRQEDQPKHLVWLNLNRKERPNFCGGSIINEIWVMTAAHCFHGKREGSRVDIYAGELRPYLSNSEHLQIVTSRYWVCHPDYDYNDGSNIADFALAMTHDRKFTFNDYVGPASIANANDERLESPGRPMKFYGWGPHDYRKGPWEKDRLRYGILEFVSHRNGLMVLEGSEEHCSTKHDRRFKLFNFNNPTSGDSGGPITIDGGEAVHAVVTASWSAHEAGHSEIRATGVLHYVSFIENHVKSVSGDQTIHQTSEHDDPGFVALLLTGRTLDSGREHHLTRCNGAHVRSADRNGRFVVTGAHCADEANGNIQWVRHLNTGMEATFWWTNDNVALFYFKDGFDGVEEVELPASDVMTRPDMRQLYREGTRLTYFNPLLGDIRSVEEAGRGEMMSMDAELVSWGGVNAYIPENALEIRVKKGFTHHSGVVHWKPAGEGRHKLIGVELIPENYVYKRLMPGNNMDNWFTMITLEKMEWISDCVETVEVEGFPNDLLAGVCQG